MWTVTERFPVGIWPPNSRAGTRISENMEDMHCCVEHFDVVSRGQWLNMLAQIGRLRRESGPKSPIPGGLHSSQRTL